MTAKASIVKDAVYDVLTVPYDCVTADEDGNSYVNIDQNGEKTQVPVTVGMESDYYVEISGDGIDENTKVYYNTPLINQEFNGEAGDMQDGITFDMGGTSADISLIENYEAQVSNERLVEGYPARIPMINFIFRFFNL